MKLISVIESNSIETDHQKLEIYRTVQNHRISTSRGTSIRMLLQVIWMRIISDYSVRIYRLKYPVNRMERRYSIDTHILSQTTPGLPWIKLPDVKPAMIDSCTKNSIFLYWLSILISQWISIDFLDWKKII